MRFQGDVVVVTGASRGLGRLIARDLADHGAHTVLSARDGRALADLVGEIQNAGGRATAVEGDVTRAADRQRLLATAEKIGPLEVLINNAGIEVPVALVDQQPEEIERQIAVNLTAPLLLAREALPAMLKRGRGVLVNVSSISGKAPTPYNAVYAAGKHALNGFTSSLRVELRGTGVHAGVVCPAFVGGTGMWADSGVKAPLLYREVAPQRVAAAVRRVIGGAAEVLVTPAPTRPLLALAQLFPKLDGLLLRATGALGSLQQRAAGWRDRD